MIKQVGEEILEFKDVNTGIQIARITEGHVCWTTKLTLTGPTTATIGQPITLTATYLTWQDEPLPTENRPIRVIADGQEIILQPVNGQAEFDFVAQAPGTYTICAEADFGCDVGSLEVLVSG